MRVVVLHNEVCEGAATDERDVLVQRAAVTEALARLGHEALCIGCSLDLAEAKARGGQELYLTVYTENWRARRFYEKYGFVEIGPYKFMVGEQADEDIIMRASL